MLLERFRDPLARSFGFSKYGKSSTSSHGKTPLWAANEMEDKWMARFFSQQSLAILFAAITVCTCALKYAFKLVWVPEPLDRRREVKKTRKASRAEKKKAK